MQLSYPLTAYRLLVEKAFCEVLLSLRFVTPFPSPDRFARFMSRLKSDNPEIDHPELCRHGLPDHWAVVQYTRGPLQANEEDEFRAERRRTLTPNKERFGEQRFGFGTVQLDFWLVGNTSSAIEACEAWYYARLYRIKTIRYQYLDREFQSRVEHQSLETFESFQLQGDNGTGFTITWSARLDVPLLTDDLTGFTVRSHLINVYDRGEVPYPLGTQPLLQAIPEEIHNPDEPLEGYLDRRRRDASYLTAHASEGNEGNEGKDSTDG